MQHSKQIQQVLDHPDFNGGYFGSNTRRILASLFVSAFGASLIFLFAKTPNPTVDLMTSFVLFSLFTVLWYCLLTRHSLQVKSDYCKLVHIELSPELLLQDIQQTDLPERKKEKMLLALQKEQLCDEVLSNRQYSKILKLTAAA